MESVISLLEEAGKAIAARERVRLSVGEVLIGEGPADDTVYVLLRGALRVSRNLDGDAPHGAHPPRSVVGEIVAFGGGRRTATVEAPEFSELLAFSPGAGRAGSAERLRTVCLRLVGTAHRVGERETGVSADRGRPDASMITASMREWDRQVSADLADCYLDLDMRGISMLDFEARQAWSNEDARQPDLSSGPG